MPSEFPGTGRHRGTGRQGVALFEAIAAYAKNIENLAALTTAVERIAQKHTSFNIQPEHYQIVGLHLIETISASLVGCQDLVRFFALLRIKPHARPLVRVPVNSFEFQPCGRTPQAECLMR